MKIVIIMFLLVNSLLSFDADCIVYPSEYYEANKKIPMKPSKFSISVNHKLMHMHTEGWKSEYYFYLRKDKDEFLYTNKESDQVTIFLGKIKNNQLVFNRFYTNNDSDVGICKLK